LPPEEHPLTIDRLRRGEFLPLNIHWFGLNITTGTLSPILLPYLVALFVLESEKNTSLATIRVISLAVAMSVQPIAGMLSDRSTHRWGRRRPFILLGTILSVLFLLVVGASSEIVPVSPNETNPTAFLVLLVGVVLVQAALNIDVGAMIGLIPDIVPDDRRGRASGVKAVMELLPAFLAIPIGWWVDAGYVWLVIGIIAALLSGTMLITVLWVEEEPLPTDSTPKRSSSVLRLIALAVIFVSITQGSVWILRNIGRIATQDNLAIAAQVVLIGTIGLIAMAGSIVLGVYAGAWVGIGEGAANQRPFIWWVVNRLLFLAAIGSIQGFALFYLRDFMGIENPATKTSILFAVVGLTLIPSALISGALADRPVRLLRARNHLGDESTIAVPMERKRLVAIAGGICAAGTLLLLLASNFAMVIFCGCILGIGTGIFMATNWALGTDLAPALEAGRYLGISNLAGAGAGIVGVGIGGPIVDFFNRLQPGLGYLVIFAIYGSLFLLSVLVLKQIPGNTTAFNR
jgi:MFS family permease